MFKHQTTLFTKLAVVSLLAGCANTSGGGSQGTPATSQSATSASNAETKPGMNPDGTVADSRKVSAGYGQKVKGINDFEGEITGKPAPGSVFTNLQIGMSMKQVTDLIGKPTDQGAYITGKAWIPFYFGADRYRFETVYKNQGRLIFAGGGLGDLGNGHLIWVIHYANEGGYR